MSLWCRELDTLIELDLESGSSQKNQVCIIGVWLTSIPIVANSLGSDFQSYLSHLPPSVSPYLDKMLDWDAKGVDRDLSEIAQHMHSWEEVLAVPFKLTAADGEAIWSKDSIGLQR